MGQRGEDSQSEEEKEKEIDCDEESNLCRTCGHPWRVADPLWYVEGSGEYDSL